MLNDIIYILKYYSLPYRIAKGETLFCYNRIMLSTYMTSKGEWKPHIRWENKQLLDALTIILQNPFFHLQNSINA